MGFHDAVTTNAEGSCWKQARSNLFWIDQGYFMMPHHELRYFKGCFLKSLLKHFPIPYQGVKIAPGRDSLNRKRLHVQLTHPCRPCPFHRQKCFPRNLQWEIMLHGSTMGKAYNDICHFQQLSICEAFESHRAIFLTRLSNFSSSCILLVSEFGILYVG